MTCFHKARNMTRSSRAKRGARAEEEGLVLRGKGGIEKAPLDSRGRRHVRGLRLHKLRCLKLGWRLEAA